MKKILVCVLVLVMCITAFVACNPTDGSTPDLSGLNSAKAYLQNQYREAATNTLADFVRLATLKVGTASFTVEWTASVTSGPQTVTVVDNGDGTVTIDIQEVDETVTEDTLYTLTATITDANGNTTTLTYNHMIPKFAVNTFAEYVAAVAGDSIIIDGIVTGILPKGNGATNDGFYMNTLDGGGVYVYGTSGAELTVGQTVRVKGTKDVYNGTHELKDSTYEVLDASVTTVTPVDYTAIYTNAEDLKDEALVEKQALLVTIKGVTIGTVGGSDGSYYYFELAGKKSYIRISGSSCPMTTAEQTAFKEAFNANFGATADVTGLITLYSGSFYLTPVSASAISNIVAPELTDQQVVDGAKEALTIVDTIKDAGKVELPTAGTGVYSDAAITWALSTTTVATLEGNVLTVAALPEADVEITLTATIAKGDATPATKEFTVKVCAPAESFIKKALTAGAALEHNTSTPDSYIIIGTVAEITSAYSEQHKNVTFTVTDGTNTIIIYRYNLDDAATIKAGDSIAIAAPIKKYNNDIEAVATFVKLEITSLKDAADAGIAGTGADGTMIYGKVKEITTAYSEQHNNITITLTDGTNDLSCYRLTGGADIAVGDYLLVTGTPSAYKGAAQMAQGATYNKTGVYVAPETPEPAEKVTTIADALTAAVGAEAELSGTVVEITEAWSSYNNMSFYISDGTNRILVYRGVTQVGLGDVVTVTGKIGNYSNSNQIAQGSTAVITTVHVCSTYTDATCTEAAKCTVCGKANGEALGHIDENPADGTCDRCGEDLTATKIPANLSFASAANKASGDNYLTTNYPGWTITGKLGQTYGGYLGFGRSGDSASSIKSSEIKTETGFTITTILKGNGSNGVATSTLTFTLVDAQGNVVATGYADGSDVAKITPVDAKDTTYSIAFTFADGKGWADVSNLVITFAKSTGNISLKSLDFVVA